MKYFLITLAVIIPILACGPYFAPTILPGDRKFKVILLAHFDKELDSVNKSGEKNDSLKGLGLEEECSAL